MPDIQTREAMPAADRTGTHGRAWLCRNRDELLRARRIPAETDATVASWIVERHGAHPVWHSYFVALIHLRPIVNDADPIIHREGATHEFWLMAMDPKARRDLPVLGKDFPAYLTPPNFMAQLIEPTDEAAVTQIEAAIDLITSGELNPDTDARRQWVALFGDHMLAPGAVRG